MDPLVEKIARAMASTRGRDPDELVPESGYANARQIPRWWKEVEWAERHLAAHRAISGAA